MTSTGLPGTTPVEMAIPTLKVMRLQKPDFHLPTAGSLQTKGLMGTAMCLPDSFGVIHVGETFTAYLGALNVSKTLHVGKLTVNAQLQTPSQRWHLASAMDEGNAVGGIDVPPESGVDAIVSHALDEPGQHILRVEVGYLGSDGNTKALRKFYRFQVSSPIILEEKVWRASEQCCFVSMSLKNNGTGKAGGLTMCDVGFQTSQGLVSYPVGSPKDSNQETPSTMLFDNCGRLEAGETFRYLFRIQTVDGIGSISTGQELGYASFSWRKSCGEAGRMGSPAVVAPNTWLSSHSQPSSDTTNAHILPKGFPPTPNPTSTPQLVTVESIDPPATMFLGVPTDVQFRVTNRSDREMALQLEFESHRDYLQVCGPRSKSLDIIAGNGGSALIGVRFLPLISGLGNIGGCRVVDLDRSISFYQPPLCQVVVEQLPM